MKTRVAVLTGKGSLRVVEEALPELGPRDVLVDVGACGICTGDLYGFMGYPVWYSLPARLGHEAAGVVSEVGREVRRVGVGDHVTVVGSPGFSDHMVVPEDRLDRVSRALKFEYAIGEPVACAVNGVRLARPRLGDTVAVCGVGFMGSLLTQCLSRAGLGSLVAVDLREDRLKLSREFGATATVNAAKDVEKQILKMTDGRGVDIAFEATANPRGVNLASRIVRKRGKLCIFSFHPRPVEVDVKLWDSKGLRVLMTTPAASPNHRKNFTIAAHMLSRGLVKLDKLVTHRFKLSEAQAAFEYASQKPEGYIKGVIIP